MASRRACLYVCSVLLLGALAVPCHGQKKKEKQQPVSPLQFLAARAERMARQLPPLPSEAAARDQCHSELLKDLPAILGLPNREPMKAAVTYQKQEGDLVVEEVVYHWAERAYVLAHLVRSQKAEGPQPALVVAPGRLGHYSRPGYRELAFALAKKGYRVLVIDDPQIGRRNAPEAGLYAVASAAGMPLAGIQVFDALRALDYLLTRTDTDPQRIGLLGWREGAQAAILAAVLERRFQFVCPLLSTDSYVNLAKLSAAEEGDKPSVAAFVPGILRFSEQATLLGCLAPRPVLARGIGRGDPASLAAQAVAWIEGRAYSGHTSAPSPALCGPPEKPDFSIFRYMQRRMTAKPGSRPDPLASAAAWDSRRKELLQWLGETCRPKGQPSSAAKAAGQSTKDGVVTERLELPVDVDLTCPARLVYLAAPAEAKHPAVVFSYDGRQCMAAVETAEAVDHLARQGYWVLVPEHASPDARSLRPIAEEDMARFYGLADMVGLPPLAWRVAENLAAAGYLASRPEVDGARILAAGQGVGGIDACLAALLEPRIAGVVSLDATTLRAWAEEVAVDEHVFWSIMPYLPSMPKTDWDLFYAALAPRPLLLAKLKEGWPKAGFQEVASAVRSAYRLQGCENALVAVSPREILAEREKAMPEGVPRSLVAIARNILPPPPSPGMIGSHELLKPRAVVDSADGLVWLVAVQGGVEQEFVDGGYRLTTWSFVNDKGAAQQGRYVTPLIFKKEGNAYRLTGVGRARANAGTGLQTFPFETVAGSDVVGDGYFFGFFTGDPAGKTNAGVVEFDDGPRDRMTILVGSSPKLAVDTLYQEQTSYPRTYSIEAVSSKK